MAAALSWREPMSRSIVSRESLSCSATSSTVSQSRGGLVRFARRAAKCASICLRTRARLEAEAWSCWSSAIPVVLHGNSHGRCRASDGGVTCELRCSCSYPHAPYPQPLHRKQPLSGIKEPPHSGQGSPAPSGFTALAGAVIGFASGPDGEGGASGSTALAVRLLSESLSLGMALLRSEHPSPFSAPSRYTRCRYADALVIIWAVARGDVGS